MFLGPDRLKVCRGQLKNEVLVLVCFIWVAMDPKKLTTVVIFLVHACTITIEVINN